MLFGLSRHRPGARVSLRWRRRWEGAGNVICLGGGGGGGGGPESTGPLSPPSVAGAGRAGSSAGGRRCQEGCHRKEVPPLTGCVVHSVQPRNGPPGLVSAYGDPRTHGSLTPSFVDECATWVAGNRAHHTGGKSCCAGRGGLIAFKTCERGRHLSGRHLSWRGDPLEVQRNYHRLQLRIYFCFFLFNNLNITIQN